eukprot:14553769-Alexandrium_andersonii.AAC.1
MRCVAKFERDHMIWQVLNRQGRAMVMTTATKHGPQVASVAIEVLLWLAIAGVGKEGLKEARQDLLPIQ